MKKNEIEPLSTDSDSRRKQGTSVIFEGNNNGDNKFTSRGQDVGLFVLLVLEFFRLMG
jgi:hypothetical protein